MSAGKILVWSFAVGAIAVAVAVLAAGAGHGSYAPARLLFPFTMLSTTNGGGIERAFLYFGLLQYPIYGTFLVIAKKFGWVRIAGTGIIAIHAACALAAFVLYNSNFPN